MKIAEAMQDLIDTNDCYMCARQSGRLCGLLGRQTVQLFLLSLADALI